MSGTSLQRKTQLCCVRFVAVSNTWDILPFYDWIFEFVLSYTGAVTCKFCAVFLTFKKICTLLPHSKPHFCVVLCTCSDEPYEDVMLCHCISHSNVSKNSSIFIVRG